MTDKRVKRIQRDGFGRIGLDLTEHNAPPHAAASPALGARETLASLSQTKTYNATRAIALSYLNSAFFERDQPVIAAHTHKLDALLTRQTSLHSCLKAYELSDLHTDLQTAYEALRFDCMREVNSALVVIETFGAAVMRRVPQKPPSPGLAIAAKLSDELFHAEFTGTFSCIEPDTLHPYLTQAARMTKEQICRGLGLTPRDEWAVESDMLMVTKTMDHFRLTIDHFSHNNLG